MITLGVEKFNGRKISQILEFGFYLETNEGLIPLF